MWRSLALAVALAALGCIATAAQQENPPPSEVSPSEEEATAGESPRTEDSAAGDGAAQPPTGEEPSPQGEEAAETPPRQEPGAAETEEAPSDQEPEAPPPPQLTPEEQAKIEEARRKREERQAKRAAKKAAEEAKAAEQEARQEVKHEEHLARVLTRGYEALERQEYKGALAAFGAYVELAGTDRFAGLIGLARTRLAMSEPAAAVERALEAAKATNEASGQAEALVLAGDASLAARPRDEATLEPLPGTELYETTALRFYLRALAADPEDGAGARARLEERFPTPADESIERLYGRYCEADPAGAAQHARRLAAAYEALISGRAEVHVAVAGGITAPVKLAGRRPPYPFRADGRARRLLAALFIEPDGSVSHARLLNGTDPALDRAAVEVFETWRFEPARLPSGEPIPVHFVVAINAVEPPAGRGAAQPGQPMAEPDGTPRAGEASGSDGEPTEAADPTSGPDTGGRSEDPPDQGEPEADE